VSYLTSILPFSPGRTGFSGFLGIVHPQDEKILEKVKGAFPVLVNSKILLPSSPFSIIP
jgi:hypothetical protein